MTTTIPTTNRFSPLQSQHRKTETDSETRVLNLFNYYGIFAERGLYVVRNDHLECGKCGHVWAFATGLPTFLKATEVFSNLTGVICPSCQHRGQKLHYFIIDLTLHRRHKIIVEVFGNKSSVKDPEKRKWLQDNHFTLIEIPNEMTEKPEEMKALCQSLAISVGSNKPEKLWELEIV